MTRSDPKARPEGPGRILILNERDPRHPRAGGAELHVARIFGRLAARGHAITQASCHFPGAAANEVIDGVRVERSSSVPLYYPRVAALCAARTRRGEFDVVIDCLNKLPFLSPLYSRAPVLAVSHHLMGDTVFQQVAWPIAAAVWSLEKLIPRSYRRSHFIAISESSREDLIQRGVVGERVRVSLCGIDRPEVDVDLRTARPKCITYLGRLEPYKRVDVFLRTAAALVTKHPDLEVLVIGRGTAETALKELASELGLGERVRFTGFVSDEERDALLAKTRVCVCPSEKEGWGLTVIEANCYGTPVVASDAPGLTESVRDGETGLLVPVGDVDANVAAVASLLEDDERWRRFAAAAYEWSAHFDWDRCADEMASAIRWACGR